MRTASDLAERVALPSSPHHEWRSCTMRVASDVFTPGTAANFAVTLAVTTLVIPRIPSRALAIAAGFAVSSALR
ncbi:MAG: hypothetical protein PHT74_09135 [Methanoculleus horonobensis]|jgi:hypothetical protein|nr:hypothetical protein [Methanoculleus horonobensis]